MTKLRRKTQKYDGKDIVKTRDMTFDIATKGIVIGVPDHLKDNIDEIFVMPFRID